MNLISEWSLGEEFGAKNTSEVRNASEKEHFNIWNLIYSHKGFRSRNLVKKDPAIQNKVILGKAVG